MNIMLYPCEGHEFNCCYDVFGTPECVLPVAVFVCESGRVITRSCPPRYRFEVTDLRDPDYGKAVQLFTDGERISPAARYSRCCVRCDRVGAVSHSLWLAADYQTKLLSSTKTALD